MPAFGPPHGQSYAARHHPGIKIAPRGVATDVLSKSTFLAYTAHLNFDLGFWWVKCITSSGKRFPMIRMHFKLIDAFETDAQVYCWVERRMQLKHESIFLTIYKLRARWPATSLHKYSLDQGMRLARVIQLARAVQLAERLKREDVQERLVVHAKCAD